jgi:ATP-dependent Clp protease protease subunit
MDETTGVFEQDSPESSVYLLFGEINTNSVVNACAWILQANFDKKKPSHLTLLINSLGGDLHAAFALIELMRGSSIPVHTVGLGQICSAGLFIFMSGAKGHRTLTPTCTIMSHTYATGIEGNHHALINIAKELNWTHERIFRHYARETGLPDSVIKEKLIGTGDYYMSPEEAVELRLADKITGV